MTVTAAGSTAGPVGGPVGDETDEDTWVPTPAWRRVRLPRRGSTRLTAPRRDPRRLVAADELLAASRSAIGDVLGHPASDPALVAAARAYLSGDADPIGGAVVAAVAGVSARGEALPPVTSNVLVDRWVADHGLPFAARAVTELAVVDRRGSRPGSTAVCRAAAEAPRPNGLFTCLVDLAVDVRWELATASDDAYAATVGALAGYRGGVLLQRVLTSFLAPTETAWVDDDCAAIGADDRASDLAALLVTAVGTHAQFDRISPLLRLSEATSAAAVTTFVDGVGPAAAPVLASWLDSYADGRTDADADVRLRLSSLLGSLPTDEAFQLLLDRAEVAGVRPVLAETSTRVPRRALRLLAAADGPVAHDLLHGHVAAYPDLVAELLPGLPPAAAARVRAAAGSPAVVAAAPASALPPLLRVPPWTDRRPRPAPIVVTGLTCDEPPAIGWLPGERDIWGSRRFEVLEWASSATIEEHDAEGIRNHQNNHTDAAVLLTVPESVGRPVLPSWRTGQTSYADQYLPRLVARYELDALPVVLDVARVKPALAAETLAPFTGTDIAVLMADWYARLKSVRSAALAWLVRHPAAAARALVPAAVGTPGVPRRQAEGALRAIAAAGHRAQVVSAAHRYGAPAAAAVDAVLAADLLDQLPATIPSLPAWTQPHLRPPVRLRDGSGTLPVSAVGHLLTMLAMSRIGEPYAGLAVVRESCEPGDLAAFAWALFQRWQAAGSPPEQDWALHAQGLLGDDDTARRLAPLICAWPGRGRHANAVVGLDVLTAIGTDAAVLHLNGIAQRVTSTSLRDRAGKKITEVARGLGLSVEGLADRLVPDFGLAGDGTLELDYGPRAFTVGFDEQLKPYVVDVDGKRRRVLPRPGAKDDPERAPRAYRRFTDLNKEVRTVATEQVRRLEQAMVARRRWSAGEFRTHLVGHPLLWHLVRRLVWTVADATGTPVGHVRVAEDRSPADVHDAPYRLPDDAVVTVAHPLLLGDDVPRWAGLFDDYEILQPFAQLDRDVHRLTADERAAARLTRYDGRSGPTRGWLGLRSRGWRSGSLESDYVRRWVQHETPDGHLVLVDLDPGFEFGHGDSVPEQTVVRVRVQPAGRWAGATRGEVPFADLDPVTASEVLRQLEEVVR